MSLERYMELFQGRSDAFAEQQEDGSYRPIRQPMARAHYIAHGRGFHTYGIYSVNEDQATKFIVWDIDTFDPKPLTYLEEALVDLGVWTESYLIEFSGRKGHHVWLPFENWAKANTAYRAGRAVLQHASIDVECYPKQEEVTDLGNLIKLPLGIHRVTGQRSRFIGWGAEGNWVNVQPIPRYRLEELAEQYEEPEPPEVSLPAASADLRPVQLLEEIATAPEGQRNQTLLNITRWLFSNWSFYSREDVVADLLEAALRSGLTRKEAVTTINSAVKFVDRYPSSNPIGGEA